MPRPLLASLSLLLAAACPLPPPDPVTTRLPATYPPAPRAEIVATGAVDCFPAGTESAPGQLASCELSSVVRAGDLLYFVNDKNFFGEAPLFSASLAGPLGALAPVKSPGLAAARKLESLTQSPDGAWIFAASAFDRVKPDPSWNPYNSLLYWPSNDPAAATLAARDETGGVLSSLPLRAVLSAALRSEKYPDGPPYFKVEGLAALPDGRLLLGVREAGARFDDFSYQLALLSLSYRVEGNTLTLGDRAERLYDFVPPVGLVGPLGLSGIEYDAGRGVLWLLTSYESASGRGAYLWRLSLADMAARRSPALVLDATTGGALWLGDKAEGLALLPGGDLLLICDDDTATRPGRGIHQAPYLRLKISGDAPDRTARP